MVISSCFVIWSLALLKSDLTCCHSDCIKDNSSLTSLLSADSWKSQSNSIFIRVLNPTNVTPTFDFFFILLLSLEGPMWVKMYIILIRNKVLFYDFIF